MFDKGWIHEHEFDIPIICIGNLAVGGTGKTPHCEWIVDRLCEKGINVATLSRGYGRKTHGYREVNDESSSEEVGDEPLQMHVHFNHVGIQKKQENSKTTKRAHVAVCENRCEGIKRLRTEHPHIESIVLDDAFQHRHVRPALRILLTDYHRLYTSDRLLPSGLLRENKGGAKRADIIIVTKCPPMLSDEERNRITEEIAPLPHQIVLFSAIQYAPLEKFEFTSSNSEQPYHLLNYEKEKIQEGALLTGIANPAPLIEHLQSKDFHITKHLRYPDHHDFSPSDLKEIEEVLQQNKSVITTEKDYTRLRNHPIIHRYNNLYVQRIGVYFLFDGERQIYDVLHKTLNKYKMT